MNRFEEKDNPFFDSLIKQQKIKASKAARDRSLLAFQQGLTNVRSLPNRVQKTWKFGKQVTRVFACATVIGISGLLLLSTGIFDLDRPGEEANIGNGKEDSSVVQVNEEEKEVDYHEEVADIFGNVLRRSPFDYNDLNAMPTQKIFNEQLEVHLPNGWTVSEMEGDNEVLIKIAGQNGEEMNLMLFHGEYSQEEFDAHIQDLTADFNKVPSETRVPVDVLIDNIRANRSPEISFPYPNIMPFETENAKISMFFDIENGQYMERYISKLFGYPMIFTSKLPFDDEESWNLPLIFFSHMYVGYSPFTIYGSEGEKHPVYERPLEKSVILRMGAIGMEQVDVTLYENDELGLTSYLPSDTNIERIEHDYFTEWRFTEPNVSEDSYYSFGKLKDGFPIEEGKEIMFESLNIDLTYYQESDGDIPHHYSYSGGEEVYINGFIQLFEVSGEWYYKHKHSGGNGNNGSVYVPRLEMFISSIEWH